MSKESNLISIFQKLFKDNIDYYVITNVNAKALKKKEYYVFKLCPDRFELEERLQGKYIKHKLYFDSYDYFVNDEKKEKESLSLFYTRLQQIFKDSRKKTIHIFKKYSSATEDASYPSEEVLQNLDEVNREALVSQIHPLSNKEIKQVIGGIAAIDFHLTQGAQATPQKEVLSREDILGIIVNKGSKKLYVPVTAIERRDLRDKLFQSLNLGWWARHQLHRQLDTVSARIDKGRFKKDSGTIQRRRVSWWRKCLKLTDTKASGSVDQRISTFKAHLDRSDTQVKDHLFLRGRLFEQAYQEMLEINTQINALSKAVNELRERLSRLNRDLKRSTNPVEQADLTKIKKRIELDIKKQSIQLIRLRKKRQGLIKRAHQSEPYKLVKAAEQAMRETVEGMASDIGHMTSVDKTKTKSYFKRFIQLYLKAGLSDEALRRALNDLNFNDEQQTTLLQALKEIRTSIAQMNQLDENFKSNLKRFDSACQALQKICREQFFYSEDDTQKQFLQVLADESMYSSFESATTMYCFTFSGEYFGEISKDVDRLMMALYIDGVLLKDVAEAADPIDGSNDMAQKWFNLLIKHICKESDARTALLTAFNEYAVGDLGRDPLTRISRFLAPNYHLVTALPELDIFFRHIFQGSMLPFLNRVAHDFFDISKCLYSDMRASPLEGDLDYKARHPAHIYLDRLDDGGFQLQYMLPQKCAEERSPEKPIAYCRSVAQSRFSPDMSPWEPASARLFHDALKFTGHATEGVRSRIDFILREYQDSLVEARDAAAAPIRHEADIDELKRDED